MYVSFSNGLCCGGLNVVFFTVQIHDVNFSNDGTKFLCISGTTQAKIFDRDGEEQYVCSLKVWDMIPYPDHQGYFC
jgi:hypothetical protein